MARTVEEGHSHRRAVPARISVCTCPPTLGGYFKQFSMQQLSTLLQIQSGSDCPHKSLFKIGLNPNTSQSSLATKESHYYLFIIIFQLMFNYDCTLDFAANISVMSCNYNNKNFICKSKV